MLTDKQKAALELGQAIRNVVCMDSLAARFFHHELRNQVRDLCDRQMNLLGYESITDHRLRLNEHFIADPYKDQPKSFYKYQKLEND